MTLLQTKKLSINFGGLWAVKDVDFAIDSHQIVGLIGPNGSGKTTFLNIISGLYKASGGKFYINDEDVTNFKPHQIYKKGISRTYQSSRLCWDLSVADNILAGLYTRQKSTFFDVLLRPNKCNDEIYEGLQKAMNMLCYFNADLVDKRYELTKNISHIDRRRIEISRALVGDPQVLLLDEPTAGLNREETMTMLHDIGMIKEQNPAISIIIIEHDMQVMKEVAQRIVVFNAGQKIAEGPYDEVINDQRVIDAYLGGAAI
ncbi:MAG: ABC transporter ATP-binding protein [Bacillota bacterium]